jgi:putative pyruvate formate lyase activating enzyme
MHRQVGALKFDERGLAKRGVLVRHLVMPSEIAGTKEIMRFLASAISRDTYTNVMQQYHPAGRVNSEKFRGINRRVSGDEFQEAIDLALEAGLWRFDERRSLASLLLRSPKSDIQD